MPALYRQRAAVAAPAIPPASALPARRSLFAAALAAMLAACSVGQQAPDFGALMRSQGPAVVNIVSLRPAGHARPGDSSQPDAATAVEDLGSGLIIDAEGIILTNAHVVSGARSITVRLADGRREYPARLLGADPRSDIAVLRIPARGLPVARIGNSAALAPGQWVAAIGSPFGFANTITAGIVSATGRNLIAGGPFPFIQSDVAVNPGSSGGPLINRAGEVVGINSMIFSPTGGYLGLSFAIPIEVALDVARRLARDGRVRRGHLGVSVQPLSRELAHAFGLDGAGMVVSRVEPGSPAAAAGLRTGDIILGFGGSAAGDSLPQRIAAAAPGSRQKVAVWRDRRARELVVTVGEEAEPAAAPAQAAIAGTEADAALVFSELPPALCARLGIGFALRVDRAPPADGEDELRYGDIVLMVGDTPFSSRRDFDRLLVASAGGYAPLLVRRGESALYVAVEVPPRLDETRRRAG